MTDLIVHLKYFVTAETMENSLVTGVFRALKLPKEVVDKICFLNPVKWFIPEV